MNFFIEDHYYLSSKEEYNLFIRIWLTQIRYHTSELRFLKYGLPDLILFDQEIL